MYIVQSIRGARKFYYVKDEEYKTGYRWVEGHEGLRAAERFRTQEAAGILVSQVREGPLDRPRMAPDPFSPPQQRPPRKRGFLVKAESERRGTLYIVLRDGLFCWANGKRAEQEAFRFSSREAIADLMTAAPFRGVAGAEAVVVPFRE